MDLRPQPCPLTRHNALAPSLPAKGSPARDWPTHRSLPVGVGEDSMDLHLALVGLGHVHPQLPAARLVGAIQTRHVVVVVVLLPPPKTETTGGMRSQAGQEPSSALPREVTTLPRASPVALRAGFGLDVLGSPWPQTSSSGSGPQPCPRSSGPSQTHTCCTHAQPCHFQTGQEAFPAAVDWPWSTPRAELSLRHQQEIARAAPNRALVFRELPD